MHSIRTHETGTRSVLALVTVLLLILPGAALAGGDWNDTQIAWQAFDEGLAQAKKSGKPVCVVFYTDWCPHCTTFSGVFGDPDVVSKSKEFVMVRLNKDENRELSARFAEDGQYIPRTFFLASDGTLDASIHAQREKFKYFYHETDPTSLLRGMDRALKKLKP